MPSPHPVDRHDVDAEALVAAYGGHAGDAARVAAALAAGAQQLTAAARRIARNALRAEQLTTDNTGQPLYDRQQRRLATLWTYVAAPKWLVAFACDEVQPLPALHALARWAFAGQPPFTLRLVDPGIPLLGPRTYGLQPQLLRPCPPVDEAIGPHRHATLISLIETCRRQGRAPVPFIAQLLRRAAPPGAP